MRGRSWFRRGSICGAGFQPSWGIARRAPSSTTIRPPDRQRGEQQDKQDRYQDAVHDYRTWRSGARFQLSVRRRRLSGRPTRQRPIADRNLQGLQAQVWRRANPLCGFRSRAGCAGSMLQPRRLCPNPGDSRQAFATPGSQWYHSKRKAETRWADAMKPGPPRPVGLYQRRPPRGETVKAFLCLYS